MKQVYIFFALLFSLISYSQVGIGTTSPNPSAILDLTASNKALLIPRLASIDSISIPVNGMMIYDESNSCIRSFENNAWTPCLSSLTQNTFAQLVYFNDVSPNVATIFDDVTPPISNDNSLKQNSTYLYIATNGQTFTWDGSNYITYTPTILSNFYFNGTTIDAQTDKTNVISRPQDIIVNGVRVGRSSGNVQTNTVIGGGGALSANTTGDNNVALGEYALGSNTTGTSNFGMGFASLGANTNGSFNVGLGRASLRWSRGNYNIGIGMQALGANSMTGSSNVGVGWLAGGQTTTGGSNVSIGTGSGGQTTGSRNITIGTDAKVTNATANGQVNIGNSLFATDVNSNNPSIPQGNWGVGVSNPTEKLDVGGAIKISNGGYSSVVDGASTPVPSGGAGTLVFVNGSFFGFNGLVWKKLDN